MSTELDYDNVVNAIKGDPLVRSCVTCKYYRGSFMSDSTCIRQLELKYHPITGKKVWMGIIYTCAEDRCISGSRSSRPEEPCGPDGKYWKEKKPGFWSSLIKKN